MKHLCFKPPFQTCFNPPPPHLFQTLFQTPAFGCDDGGVFQTRVSYPSPFHLSVSPCACLAAFLAPTLARCRLLCYIALCGVVSMLVGLHKWPARGTM